MYDSIESLLSGYKFIVAYYLEVCNEFVED